jgi:hypothetical protein
MYPGIAQALVAYAKEAKERMIVAIRETSAQAFFQHKDGDYDEPTSIPGNHLPHSSQFCCQDMSSNVTEPWRATLFKEALNNADSRWNEYIQWINFYHKSSGLYDMHVENGRTGLDCTHFIYSPFMLDFLWHEILVECQKRYQQYQHRY